MFNLLTMKNIRMFNNDLGKFNLSPLTVLCGTNGSGKSSIFKTLLLIKQSQIPNKSRSGHLRFVGDYVDLGNYDSFVSYNDTSSNIEISLRNSDMMPKVTYEYLLKYAGLDNEDELDDYVDYEAEVKLVFSRVIDTIDDNKRKRRLNMSNDLKRANGKLLEAYYNVYIKDELVLDWHLIGTDITIDDKIHREYNIHIPHKYFESVGGNKIMIVDEADETGYVSIEVLLDGLFPDAVRAVWKNDENPNDSEGNKNKYPLPPAISIVTSDLIDRLNGIHHIGPLRAPGKRYYLASDDEIGLDSSGEFLPYILRDRKNALVFNCLPDKDWQCEDAKLIDAVNYWLHYFRTGIYSNKTNCKHEIDVRTKETVLVNFDLKNQKGDHSFSLADSGFGYSQILPIIIKCLMANIDDTILIEQPELHLNPAIQVRLAEFFVAMSISYRQIIIETHSEHIVNAIRVLSAESDIDEIRDNTKIFYLTNCNELPVIHELSINSDGTVPNWPKEFFGEALSLSGRLLRAQKRKLSINKEANNCLH